MLATLVNPYGWGLERYLYENWSVPQILTIAELLPPSLPTYRAFFVYAALAALSMLMPWRAASLSELAATAIFGALGAMFLRFTPLLFIVTAPVVADRAGRLIARGIDGRAVVATTIAASLLISRVPIARARRICRQGIERSLHRSSSPLGCRRSRERRDFADRCSTA